MGKGPKSMNYGKFRNGLCFGGGLDDLVNPPDSIEYCAKVSVQPMSTAKTQTNESTTHRLAIVKNQQEAGLLLLADVPKNMLPVVLNILPIYSDFKYSIAQVPMRDKTIQGGMQVTFLSQKNPAPISVIFQDSDMMSGFLEEAKTHAKVAPRYSETSHSHAWLDTYKKFRDPLTGYIAKKKKEKADVTVPHNEVSALHYVLPLQRTDSSRFVNLRRKDTLKASKGAPQVESHVAMKNWINARMMEKENEFVDWENTTVFSGTWNVHGNLPDDSLSSWFSTARSADGQPVDPDFYVIGLQEMDTSAKSYAFYDPTKENAWTRAILGGLGQKAKDYYIVASQQLVTILIVVIAKKVHKGAISEVTTNYVGVGLMNYMGNKGGAAVRMRFHDSYLCFVTSHLAAFINNVERRNTDFQEICKRMLFSREVCKQTEYVYYSWNDGGDEGVSYLENLLQDRPDWGQYASIFHSDHLIWVGDLNYRVDLPPHYIKSKLWDKELDPLLDCDQLNIERRAGRVFSMFEEGNINFLPTYKFDVGTNNFDSSAKRRAPSWTDRILWKKERGGLAPSKSDQAITPHLELLHYGNCMEMMSSDHKPVQALIRLKIRKINKNKQEEKKKELEKLISENKDHTVKGRLQSRLVDFGKVEFMAYQERTITLENTGLVLAQYRFITNELTQEFPSWLRIHPLSGFIGPGEKAVLYFEVLIDPTISHPFNAGLEKLESLLILRLENAEDYYISVRGDYIKTRFGMNLKDLTLVPYPVNETLLDTFKDSTSPTAINIKDTSIPLPLPKELWRLLNLVWNKNMLSMDNLFLEHGDRTLTEYIRRCLDSGEPYDPDILFGSQKQESEDAASEDGTTEDDASENGSGRSEQHSQMTKEALGANSVIDVLVTFLECLPDPVIPSSYYKSALQAAEPNGSMQEFVKTLPDIHRNVLLHIADFLNHAIHYAPNACRGKRKAYIIETFIVLIKPPIDFPERNPREAIDKRKQFVARLLQ